MSAFASCKFCKKWNTHSYYCREYPKKTYCFSCFKYGHTSNHCIFTMRALSINRINDRLSSVASVVSSSSKIKGENCQKCGKEGHKNQECKMCCICWERETIYAAIPCGHKKYCLNCIQGLEVCAICRTEIDSYIRVYD